MGIGKGAAILLMKEAVRRPFEGRLLTLGRQEVSISHFQLKHYAKRAGLCLTLPPVPEDPYSLVDDKKFYSFLGFSESQSLDYSDFEGASIQFDLNSGEIPESFRETFDVIYDGGTLEHVFHLPNALKTVIGLLKPGGRLIHLNPASNHMEHSFYMFSPTFFSDFYTANRFEINYIQLIRYTSSQDYEWLVYDYTPGCLDRTDIGSGLLDTGMYLVHTVVTKTSESINHAIPNQSIYSRDMWVGPKKRKKPSLLRKILKDKEHQKWKQLFKRSFFYFPYAYCKQILRRHGVPLKPTDRF